MKAKNTRITAFIITIMMVFIVLALRLAYLQVVNGDYYKILAEDKAEREIIEIAPRGEILDRNGLKIATNKQCYNITFTIGKQTDDSINDVLLNTVNVLIKNSEQDKVNVQSLPINYDSKTGKFEFSFNVSSQELVDKLSVDFKKSNKIEEGLDAKATFYKLAESFKLVTQGGSSSYININNISNDTLYKIVALRMALKNISYKQYQPIYVANNVKKETSFEIEMNSNSMPGIMCELAPLRYYPYGETGSAFIGYLGKINNNLDTYINSGYDVSRELIGKDRLEGLLENNKDLNIQLRGEPGITYVQVDKYGKVIKNSAKKDPIPGDTVVTTIDMNLKKAAEKALDETMAKITSGGFSSKEKYPNANRGAVVVLDVNTGEILALVSRPGYDPNVFAETGGIKDTALFKKYFLPGVTDRFDTLPKPMFNYALSGKAPPGSIFKPLTAIAGLTEGVINENYSVVDTGIYTVLDGFAGKCWIYDEKRLLPCL
jgi:penicillin-binding protein 2